jgi:DNA-binding winged helix-turn-helix (wHTH) protein
MNESRAAAIWFGQCCVLPRARRLLVDGQPTEVGGRAFDLLMVLISAPGTLVTKNEIMSRVWSDTVVEEANLKVQVAALRKVLSEDRDVIKTVHGRGYVFASEVTAASAEPVPLTARGAHSLDRRPGDKTYERRSLAAMAVENGTRAEPRSFRSPRFS